MAAVVAARATAVAGDITKAKKAYKDFLAFWKDADMPMLIEARKEDAALN